jgi:HSP90 family molecular chaperone
LTADANTPTTEARTQSFEADVSRLLHLMVHSVYSDRAIFVRELVSNAADACEKLRYEAIAKPELIEDGAPFAIEIAINPDAKTLTFSDNGVGMTREDLTQGLGTIARSGTKAFLDKLAADDASKEAAALIGQFGIGFYSSFMVADEVVVDTRRAGAKPGAGRRTARARSPSRRSRSNPRRNAVRASSFTSTTKRMSSPSRAGSSALCASTRARSPCRST